jgi:hypothetical protein
LNQHSQQAAAYPPNTGSFAQLGEDEKKKRLDAMVRIWQSDTQRRMERGAGEDLPAFLTAVGLDEYRYVVWLRFPEWERSSVVGQVITLRPAESETAKDDASQKSPVLFSSWRHEPLLKMLPDWKQHLPNETVFNISVRITPGGLGEGSKWAVVMPKDLIPRYRPGWPTQQEWVTWTRSFDWLSVGIGFIRSMLDS